MTVSGAEPVSFGYDGAGRLETVTRGSAVVSYGYNDDGTLAEQLLPGSQFRRWAFDPWSGLLEHFEQFVDGTYRDTDVAYDTMGRLFVEWTNGEATVFRYDQADQLTRVLRSDNVFDIVSDAPVLTGDDVTYVMTQVYEMRVDSSPEYSTLVLSEESARSYDAFKFDGHRLSPAWTSPRAVFGGGDRLPDVLLIEGTVQMALSRAAIQRLKDVTPLDCLGELLEIESPAGPYFALNVTNVRPDALDRDRTAWVNKGQRLAVVPEFLVDQIGECSLFKTHPRGPIYCVEGPPIVGEGFYSAVRACMLRGLVFELVWDAESGGKRNSFFERFRQ